MDQLKITKQTLRGQLIFKEAPEKYILDKYGYSNVYNTDCIPFNSFQELESQFEDIRRLKKESNIHKLHFYELGYFIS
jgi:hypothetical protein